MMEPEFEFWFKMLSMEWYKIPCQLDRCTYREKKIMDDANPVSKWNSEGYNNMSI